MELESSEPQVSSRPKGLSVDWERVVVVLGISVGALCSFLAYEHIKLPHVGSSRGQVTKTTIEASRLAIASSLCLGSADAPFKLVMFGDYQCPPCRKEWPLIEKLVALHPGKLAVFFRNYPLAKIHPYALDAAVAAEESKSRGAFREMHRLLYGSTLSPKSIITELSLIGIRTPMDLAHRLPYMNRVADDINLANSLGVTGTPSFFLIDNAGEVFMAQSLDSAADFIS